MIEYREPKPTEIPRLRQLWKTVFHESDAFVDLFFQTAYAPQRCRVAADGDIAAVLYWFDCQLQGKPVAYIYGVATDPNRRGRGLATALLADTHDHLKNRGYAFAILVPAGESLFRFYEARGYQTVGWHDAHAVTAGQAIPYREIPAGAYAGVRKKLLPEHSVIQEGENLALLAGYARFFAGDGWCAVYTPGESPVFPEFLGDLTAAPGLLAALEIPRAAVYTPGGVLPFAMAAPLADDLPGKVYFAFAFD